VGRASNRKKAQRQAGLSSQQAKQKSQADGATQQAMLQVVGALKALVQESQERKAREAAARRTWSGGAEPVPAEAPRSGAWGRRAARPDGRRAPCWGRVDSGGSGRLWIRGQCFKLTGRLRR